MKSSLGHIQFNVNPSNLPFYKDFLTLMGWTVIHEEAGDFAGYKSEKNGDLWFVKSPKNDVANSDMVGMSHVALKVENQSDVDEVYTFLKNKGMNAMYDTPRHRPEFAGSEKETYYQILFESPDKILFEVVYVGIKS